MIQSRRTREQDARMRRIPVAIPRLQFVIFQLVTTLLAFGAPQKEAVTRASESVQDGINLVMQGNCVRALVLLDGNLEQLPRSELKYQGGLAMTRCAMSLNRTDDTVHALLLLGRDFPQDPEVLFMSAHFYSQLAN